MNRTSCFFSDAYQISFRNSPTINYHTFLYELLDIVSRAIYLLAILHSVKRLLILLPYFKFFFFLIHRKSH